MRTLTDTHLKRQDRRAIDEAARLLRECFPVEQVTLFGSKARGTDDPDSDIDLLALTSRPLSWKERGAMIDALFDVQLAHDVLFNVLAIPTREWKEGPYIVLPIHEEIDRDGVEV
jgi:predicted nucleotidyltransferase